MRTPAAEGRAGRVVERAAVLARALALAAAVLLLTTGCGRLFRSYDLAPNGQHRTDAALRALLGSGRADSALALTRSGDAVLPGDELLRDLYLATLARQAGLYGESSILLQRAEDLAEDRYTRSLSRNALSLVSGDRILPYEPVPTERLLIHYFGALNYLDLGDPAGAAVEARRLSFLLDHFDDRDAAGRQGLVFFRLFAGAVFEAAGEFDEAGVAYRKLAGPRPDGSAPPPGVLRGVPAWASADHALDGEPGSYDPSGGGPARGVDGGYGEVVVLVDRGFVAHRVEEAVYVILGGADVAMLAGGDAGDRALIAGEIAAHVLARVGDTRRLFTDRNPRSPVVVELPRLRHGPDAAECREAPATSAAEPGGGVRPAPGGAAEGNGQSSAAKPNGAVTPAPAETPKKDTSAPPARSPERSRDTTPEAKPGQRRPLLTDTTIGDRTTANRGAGQHARSEDAAKDGGARVRAARDTRAGRTPARRPAPAATGAGHGTAGTGSTAARAAVPSGPECRSENPYLLKVAWPAFRQDRRPTGAVRVELEGGPAELQLGTISYSLDISDGVVGEFGADRGWTLARAVVRAASKLAITRAVEREISERDERVGTVVGILANAGAVLLEQADTRSWHLAPASLQLVRIRLPAGEHRLTLDVEGPGRGGTAGPVRLDPVVVRPGEVRVVSARLYR